jgi:protein O-mannosyl-transferase
MGSVMTGKTPVRKKILIRPEKWTFIPYNSKKANRYFTLFFFICSLILYGNTIFNDYNVDDTTFPGPQHELVKKGFTAIPGILDPGNAGKSDMEGNGPAGYHPVAAITFAVENGLWGSGRAWPAHLVNLLIYFLISTLLFFLLKRSLTNFNILFPFLITLLFMAHPVHTEAVASLKNRDELLAFLCGLGALHYFLSYAGKRKIRFAVYAVAVFLAGTLSSPSVLPFILICPLFLYFFTELKPGFLLRIFLALLAVALVARFLPGIFLPKALHIRSFIENPLFLEKSIWPKTGAGLITLLFYLKILLFPYPLLYYYGYAMIPVSGWESTWVLISFALHSMLFIYAVMNIRQKHILSFAILYYFAALVCYSNILSPVAGIVGERYALNASVGFCIFLVYLIFKICRTDPRSLTIEFSERARILVVIILLLVPCTAMTIQRNREWKNISQLYAADLDYLDKSVRTNIRYAEYLSEMVSRDYENEQNRNINEQRVQEIITRFRRALKMYVNDYATLNDLAKVYLDYTTKYDSGVIFLKKAISLQPGLQPAWMNLASAYRKKNNLDSAIACYRQVLKINPNAMAAVFRMADLYFEKGEFVRAVGMNEEVMKVYPDLDLPYLNIGYYFLSHGDTTEAIKYWEEAEERNPGYNVCRNLGMIYGARGENAKANHYFDLANKAIRKGKKEKQP